MRARSRLAACLALVMISCWLGVSQPARAAKLSAKTTDFQIELDTEGGCVCFPASLATEGCQELCDPALVDEAQLPDRIELIFLGWMRIEGDQRVLVYVMTDDVGYDPEVALDTIARPYISGYTASAELESHGVDDPRARYDLAQFDQLPFARFTADAQGTRHLTHFVFGTHALVIFGVAGVPGDDEAMSELAHTLLQSIRLPAQAPSRMHEGPPSRTEEQMEAAVVLGLGLIPIALIVWLAIHARRRRRERMSE